jgi:chromosome segregation ATPase
VTSQPSTGYPTDPPRAAALSHGPEAEALLDEVRASIATLAGLLVYQADLGQEVAASIRRAVEEVEKRLKRRELRVAIVGEAGSGKSTLVDALLGERLLGMTKTEPSIVVSVRRAETRAYRARLKTGAVEDFSVRVPDPTAKLAQALASAETAVLEAHRRADESMIEFIAACDAVDVAEADLNAAFRTFEEARDAASRLGAELDQAERTEEATKEEASQKALALPAFLRKSPRWWALWSWLAWLVVVLFTVRAFRAYRRLVHASNEARADVETRRLETSRAAERVKEAEANLAAANAPVEQSRKAQVATKRIRSGAESRRDELEREAERRRAELEAAREERRQRFAVGSAP